ncbi:MAG: hypothetical protein ACI89X_004926, partial [Planctomycetota bacterium]
MHIRTLSCALGVIAMMLSSKPSRQSSSARSA